MTWIKVRGIDICFKQSDGIRVCLFVLNSSFYLLIIYKKGFRSLKRKQRPISINTQPYLIQSPIFDQLEASQLIEFCVGILWGGLNNNKYI